MTRKYCLTSAVVDGANLVLTPTNSPTFSNTRKICFTISPSIVNPATEPLPTVINMTVNGAVAQVALWDKFGNPVYSNTLRRGITYVGYMGNGTANHVLVLNTPC